MIEKMKYINIMGPIADMDRVVEKYLSKYDIHLEYASRELVAEKGLTPFTAPNPYAEPLRKAEELAKVVGVKKIKRPALSKDEALEIIEYASDYFKGLAENLENLKQQRNEFIEAESILTHFTDLEFPLERLGQFSYIQYQFGRLPNGGFKQYKEFLYNDPQILLVKGEKEEDALWCVYFTSKPNLDRVDSVFSSLHFEKKDLPLEVCGTPLFGTPLQACAYVQAEIKRLDAIIINAERSIIDQADANSGIAIDKSKISEAYSVIKHMYSTFEARKFAARTKNNFYIFVGWISKRDVALLEAELEHDKDVVLVTEDHNESIISKPPTKLHNLRIFRPFEFFVRMYGLPSYNEIDPTPLVAITYTLLFGIMFGDVGQGALLFAVGLLMWKLKGFDLGKIMCVISCSSMLFGMLYGSMFGYEFTPLWMHPAETENINTVLLMAVALGAVLIIISMVFNILNAFKRRDGGVVFDASGVAGLVFYISAIVMIMLMLTGAVKISTPVIVVLIAVPLFLIAFKEPLLKLIKKQRARLSGYRAVTGQAHKISLPMFLLETVIELFEVCLSYFTNTVSFIRVGAFALSHASMMGVVWMLSQTASGSNNMVVVVLGNFLVIVLEGLIAGIQVLRLEFYEMFSRYYEGGGKQFTPYNS